MRGRAGPQRNDAITHRFRNPAVRLGFRLGPAFFLPLSCRSIFLQRARERQMRQTDQPPPRCNGDNPALYHATTILGFGEVVLKGLHADRFTFLGQGDALMPSLLKLYNHGRRGLGGYLAGERRRLWRPGLDFGVAQTAAGVNIHADGTSFHHPDAVKLLG
jgi:hypothetical protein